MTPTFERRTRPRRALEKGKPPILGMIERGGEVVIKMLPDVKQRTIEPIITETIAPGAMVMTDEYDIYTKLPEWATATRRSVIAAMSTRATKTATVFAKSMSTH